MKDEKEKGRKGDAATRGREEAEKWRNGQRGKGRKSESHSLFFPFRNFRSGTLCLALLLQIFLHGSALSQTEPLVKRLEGTWQGDGKAFGMAARLNIKVEWVLANKFLRLSIRNEMRSANGQAQVFEGHAYYRDLGEGKYSANWFDSRGETFPIKAQVDGDALVALWGTPEREQGRSVYRIIESGKVEVVDSVLQKDGTFREFGRFVLTRQ